MKSVADIDRLLDVNEAAALLRIKASTLYGWVHQRRIPFRKHGSKVLFLTSDLLSWSKSKEISVLDGSARPDIHFRGNGMLRRKATSSLKSEQTKSKPQRPDGRLRDGNC